MKAFYSALLALVDALYDHHMAAADRLYDARCKLLTAWKKTA